jgi:hypothetical protein
MGRQFAYLACIVGPMAITPASADDTPVEWCSPISRHTVELHGKTQSTLTDDEREHIEFYFADLKRKGRRKPDKPYLLRSVSIWEPAWSFSIMFPKQSCEIGCVGAAIFPRENDIRIQEFSYRTNMLLIQAHVSPVTKGDVRERPSISAVFLNRDGDGFVRFFDILQMPLGQPWRLPNLQSAKSVASVAEPFLPHERYKTSYETCLDSVSEIGARVSPDHPR